MHNTTKIVDSLALPYTLSSQQMTAVDFTLNGSGNAILEAVAGSGKTSTLKVIIQAIKATMPAAKIIYLVFNVKNKEEAEKEIPKTLADVKTLHGAGMGACYKVFQGLNMNDWDKRKAIQSALESCQDNCQKDDKGKLICHMDHFPFNLNGFVFDLLSKAKSYGLGVLEPCSNERLEELVDHFSMETQLAKINGENINLYDLVNQGIELTKQALEISVSLAVKGLIDYDDMIYMPIKANVKMNQYDWVLLDEAQDTSPIRRAIAKKSLKPGGRFIAVGDRHQAIYGFTGADNDSLDLIKADLNCKELPLTVSFRCPKSHVRFVQQWVSHIQAADNAIEGEILSGSLSEFKANVYDVQPLDVALCRNLKPLMEIAWRFLSQGIACQILGKDLSKGLVKLVTKWKTVHTLAQLRDRLDKYVEEQTQTLLAKGKEVAAGNLQDQVECLQFMIDEMPGDSSLKDLENKILGMFVAEDKPKDIFTFSTIHKAKGREFDRVFWLQRDKFQPSPYARQAWQAQQETNLMYVAGTRSKRVLVDIS